MAVVDVLNFCCPGCILEYIVYFESLLVAQTAFLGLMSIFIVCVYNFVFIFTNALIRFECRGRLRRGIEM